MQWSVLWHLFLKICNTLLMHLSVLLRLMVLRCMGWLNAVQLDPSLDENSRVAKVNEGVTCEGFYITQ